MQIQPTSADPTISSLDRTDVLPVLDVEVYEQTLVEKSRSLSRTDTWTVEALRDIDELIESATHEAPTEVRAVNVNRTAAPAAEAFTVNVERILKRIADLEADIVTAHDANAVLHKRIEALQLERDQHGARIEALTAEQARLAAEARRQAEEAEKLRVAVAERAEQERQEKLVAELRGELAEYKVKWEALEREERSAERRLADVKSDVRSNALAPSATHSPDVPYVTSPEMKRVPCDVCCKCN